VDCIKIKAFLTFALQDSIGHKDNIL